MRNLDLAEVASISQAVAGVIQRNPSNTKEGWDDWDDWLDTDEHADADADPE